MGEGARGYSKRVGLACSVSSVAQEEEMFLAAGRRAL